MPDYEVDFLIIGGAKCATTWLQNSLQSSPGIAMPDAELHYFSRNYDRGPDWYAEELPAPKPGTLIGEKSNSYLTEPAAAARIRQDLPDVKLIVQMRHPVERAYSDYCMLYRRGSVDENISLHLDPVRSSAERFLADGCYAQHLERFLSLFPAERFLFLLYDDITQRPEMQLQRLARHIGYTDRLARPIRRKIKDKNLPLVPLGLRKILNPLRPVLDPLRDTAPVRAVREAVARPVVHPPLGPDLQRAMQEFYAPEIRRLEVITGLALDRWAPQEQQGTS